MVNRLIMKYPTSWHGEMWREGAPCGNGKVGALVYGAVKMEKIMLSHAYLWRGGIRQEMPDISDSLKDVRKYLDENRPDLADGILSNAFAAKGYNPHCVYPTPIGDIVIDSNSNVPFFGYRRVIDMEKAEVSVTWREGDVNFKRSVFVSRANGLVYTKISADKPGSVSVRIRLTIHDTETLNMNDPTVNKNSVPTVRDGLICYISENVTCYEKAKGDYGAVAKVSAVGGSVSFDDRSAIVENADEVTIVTGVFVGGDREKEFEKIAGALECACGYEEELKKHAALHFEKWGGVNFDLGAEKNTSNEELLIDAFSEGMSDELCEKLYAYGRYLFVCSTDAKDTLPMHLIGLWNGTFSCFWSIYMYNVNFEMMYWQALSGNLPGYLRLALDYVESFMDDYRTNAKNQFGCRGIYINSVNTPESGLSVCLANHILNWTAGAGWVSQQFWDYYRYTGDTDYLKEHAMPFMYEAALFYEDFLRFGKDGYYEFAPGTSPENVPSSSYRFGPWSQCTKNPAMDIGVVKELLNNLIEGAEICGMYNEKIPKWKEMLSLLPPLKTNPDGSLKEWADDFYEDNNKHRHHSHMYEVFPGHTVMPGDALFDAFVKAEDKRMTEGRPYQSSWSMIYMACVNARMRRGNESLEALSDMARLCLMGNLFTVSNDWRRMGPINCDDMRAVPVQLDANVGFPAAINEMLLFTADNNITLLPALPEKWKSGQIEGLLATGGITVSVYWDCETARAVLHSEKPCRATVRSGSGYSFNGSDEIVCEFCGDYEIKLNRNNKKN